MSMLFGTNNYVYVPRNAGFDSIADSVTLMAWVNFTALVSTGMIINRMVGAAPGNEWWSLDANGTPVLRALVGDASSVSAALATTAPALAINTWYHMAMTYDGTTLLAIQDAVQVGSAARTMTFPADTTGVVVGANAQQANDTGITEFLNGYIEDLRVYKRAVSLNEIVTIRSCEGRDNITDNLLFRMALNEKPAGTVASLAGSVKDSGPLGMHGTPYGSCMYGPSPFGLRRMTNAF